jgi:hypothetical protein
MNTETGEVCVAATALTFKAKDRRHAAEQFSRQKNACQKVHPLDTWPASEEFWKTVFGAFLVCRLCLFHWLNIIIRTPRKELFLFGPAVVDLKDCVHWLDQEDGDAVQEALRDGNMNGKKVSTGDRGTMSQTTSSGSNSRTISESG